MARALSSRAAAAAFAEIREYTLKPDCVSTFLGLSESTVNLRRTLPFSFFGQCESGGALTRVTHAYLYDVSRGGGVKGWPRLWARKSFHSPRREPDSHPSPATRTSPSATLCAPPWPPPPPGRPIWPPRARASRTSRRSSSPSPPAPRPPPAPSPPPLPPPPRACSSTRSCGRRPARAPGRGRQAHTARATPPPPPRPTGTRPSCARRAGSRCWAGMFCWARDLGRACASGGFRRRRLPSARGWRPTAAPRPARCTGSYSSRCPGRRGSR